GEVGDDRRGAGRGVRAAVRGVAGLVHQQPVGGGDLLFVPGAARVGDVRGADILGVDLDAFEARVEAGRCAAAGAGRDDDGQVGAPGEAGHVAGPGPVPVGPV